MENFDYIQFISVALILPMAIYANQYQRYREIIDDKCESLRGNDSAINSVKKRILNFIKAWIIEIVMPLIFLLIFSVMWFWKERSGYKFSASNIDIVMTSSFIILLYLFFFFILVIINLIFLIHQYKLINL